LSVSESTSENVSESTPPLECHQIRGCGQHPENRRTDEENRRKRFREVGRKTTKQHCDEQFGERQSEMTTGATIQRINARIKRRSAMLLALTLGAALAALVAMVIITARPAEAPSSEKIVFVRIVFVSGRTTGKGVNNPTGDSEIFRMNPNDTGVKQLAFNQVRDSEPVLSPDGQKIAYLSDGIQTSNPQGDAEVYVMNALDGSDSIYLSNNGGEVEDSFADFSPDGQKIAYMSSRAQTSNPEGDREVYSMNILDGSGKRNLTNNGDGVFDDSTSGVCRRSRENINGGYGFTLLLSSIVLTDAHLAPCVGQGERRRGRREPHYRPLRATDSDPSNAC
jgi:WD40-like Beta Propeller Repeat